MVASLFERLRPAVKATSIESTPSTEAATGLLEQLEQERPLPPPPIDERNTPLERLQKWLRRWHKSTITLRDLYRGPHRNKQITLNLVQELVQLGWLIPIVARRRDMMKWKVVPKGQRPTAPTTQPPSQPTAAA
jgi:hypothetical protein